MEVRRRIGSSTSILPGRMRYLSPRSLKFISVSSNLERSAQLRVIYLRRRARRVSRTGEYPSVIAGYVITAIMRDPIAVTHSILAKCQLIVP